MSGFGSSSEGLGFLKIIMVFIALAAMLVGMYCLMFDKMEESVKPKKEREFQSKYEKEPGGIPHGGL